jgi:hypothetical protein
VEDNRLEHAPIEALTGLVARATGTPPSAVRVGLRPPIDHQSNRLYDVWAGGRRLVSLITVIFQSPDDSVHRN